MFCSLAFAQNTGDSQAPKKIKIVGHSTTPNPDIKPLFVLVKDSKFYNLSKLGIEKIKPKWIKSLTVIEREKETSQYGEDGKYGVVLLEFEPQAFKHFSTENLEVLTLSRS